MNPNIRPASNMSRQQAKRVRNAAIATRNQIAMRRGEPVRMYIAPRNAGFLGGNRATRQRRLSGFAAMHTVRSPFPGRRMERIHSW